MEVQITGPKGGGEEVIEALLQGGADPNQADDAGRLPLHWCASKGHVKGAEALLRGGARPKGTDKEGFTPLHRCAQEEPQGKEGEEEEDVYRERLDTAKAEIAKILLKEGANTQVCNKTCKIRCWQNVMFKIARLSAKD